MLCQMEYKWIGRHFAGDLQFSHCLCTSRSQGNNVSFPQTVSLFVQLCTITLRGASCSFNPNSSSSSFYDSGQIVFKVTLHS